MKTVKFNGFRFSNEIIGGIGFGITLGLESFPIIGSILLCLAFSICIGLISYGGAGVHNQEASCRKIGLKSATAFCIAFGLGFCLTFGPTLFQKTESTYRYDYKQNDQPIRRSD